MKYLNTTGVLLALLTFSSDSLIAQDRVSDGLAALKAQRDLAARNSIAEIDKVYVVKLKELQKKYMDKQNLEGAIAVKEELASIATIAPGGLTMESLEGDWILHGEGPDYSISIHTGRMSFSPWGNPTVSISRDRVVFSLPGRTAVFVGMNKMQSYINDTPRGWFERVKKVQLSNGTASSNNGGGSAVADAAVGRQDQNLSAASDKKIKGVKWLARGGSDAWWVEIDNQKSMLYNNWHPEGVACVIDGNAFRVGAQSYVYHPDTDILTLDGTATFYRPDKIPGNKSTESAPKPSDGEEADSLFGRRIKK